MRPNWPIANIASPPRRPPPFARSPRRIAAVGASTSTSREAARASTNLGEVGRPQRRRREDGPVGATPQLGSTGYITDRTGQILQHEEYLPSGEGWIEELKNSSASNRLPWQFNAKELDETGLYYYGARYYNPRAGVWMSPDPAFGGGVESPQHLALYTYAGNNPVNVTDPTGLVDVPINRIRSVRPVRDKGA